jgi:hypothetical protein
MITDDTKATGAEDAELETPPESTATDQGQDTQGAPDGDGGKGDAPETKPEPNKTEKALDAFSKGVESATDPSLRKDPVGDDASAGATGVGDSAQANGATGATAAGDKAGASETKTEEQLEQEKREAEVQAELKELGVRSDKGRKRIRSLLERPTWDEVNQRFDPVIALAKQAQTYQAILTETRSSPEQAGQMFKMLGDYNSGVPERQDAAIDSLYAQLKYACNQRGRSMPAIDPIDNFPDLKEQLENGEVTRAGADEIMRARSAGRVTETQRKVQADTDKAASERKAAVDAAMNDIRAFDASVKGDPLYNQKLPMLQSLVDRLKRTGVHPSKWAEEIRIGWRELRVEAPRPAPAKPAPAPMRAGNGAGGPARVAGIPKDPAAAFEMGLENFNRGGAPVD